VQRLPGWNISIIPVYGWYPVRMLKLQPAVSFLGTGTVPGTPEYGTLVTRTWVPVFQQVQYRYWYKPPSTWSTSNLVLVPGTNPGTYSRAKYSI